MLSISSKDATNEHDMDFEEKIGLGIRMSKSDKIRSKSIVSSIDCQTIRNAFVIMIGICDYSNARKKEKTKHLHDLDGVFFDVQNMYYLWNNIYCYNKNKGSIKIIANCNDSKQSQPKSDNVIISNYFEAESNTILNDKQELLDLLLEYCSIINVAKCHDSLIFIYSGHGLKDKIILANGDLVELEEIYDAFNGKICKQLRNRLKLFILDCCRGGQFAKLQEKDEKESEIKGTGLDNKYHPYAGFATIFSNVVNYVSGAHRKKGSYLIQSIYKTFENDDLVSNLSLRDLVIIIRKQTKEFAGIGEKKWGKSAQCVDFHESLEFKVYFEKNEKNGSDDLQSLQKKQVKNDNNNNMNENNINNNDNKSSNQTKSSKDRKKSKLFFWQ